MRRIEDAELKNLSSLAARSPRLRANLNLHPTLDDPVQRFLNAIEPGSYVRPHRHAEVGRWEFALALAGAAVALTFDEAGEVVERVEIAADGPVRGVEIPGGACHAVAGLERGTVLLELKPGPYRSLADKDFAAWAPAEGEPGAAALEQWYRTARPGDRAPSDAGGDL